MFQVVKRDGEVDEFKIGKSTAAIHKAFDAKEKNYSEEMIDLLGLRVTSDFQKKITDNKITVEDIQDSVDYVHMYLRKWAHFIVYFIESGLLVLAMKNVMKARQQRGLSTKVERSL